MNRAPEIHRELRGSTLHVSSSSYDVSSSSYKSIESFAVAHYETFEELMDYVRDENLQAHTGCAVQALEILKNLLDAQVREHILVRAHSLVRDILLFFLP